MFILSTWHFRREVSQHRQQAKYDEHSRFQTAPVHSGCVLALTTAAFAGDALAKDLTITVWAGGSNDSDVYRLDAIEMAADILSREYAIAGEDLNITVEKKRDFAGWEEFKQAVTLAAEAGSAPNIVVTSHLDIAPWSQSGLIVPVEDYVDMDTWPINNIYENLLDITTYNGVVYGLPQDAESRPFFFWRETMKKIGYTDEEIDALPAKVEAGEYTLQNVLEDAKKAVDMEIVEEGYGFYPRVSNGPDYAQFYQSFGGELMDSETGKLILDKQAMTDFYQFFVDAVEAKVTRKNHIGTEWDQCMRKWQPARRPCGTAAPGTMRATPARKVWTISSATSSSRSFRQAMKTVRPTPSPIRWPICSPNRTMKTISRSPHS